MVVGIVVPPRYGVSTEIILLTCYALLFSKFVIILAM